MFKKTLCVLASLVLVVAAWAQAQLGTVGSVDGLVTYSDGTTIGNAVTGMSVTDGMRFVSSSGGSMKLQIGGCGITMKPNQTLTVKQGMSCDDLAAAVQDLGGDTRFAFDSTGALVLVAAGLAGLAVLNNPLSNQ
jgi:hypothetical protein